VKKLKWKLLMPRNWGAHIALLGKEVFCPTSYIKVMPLQEPLHLSFCAFEIKKVLISLVYVSLIKWLNV